MLLLLACISLISTAYTINRPVYKVVLTQKGFTQFLQYDVETPPLREFTFCTWIRLYKLENDQSLFSYIAKGNKRILRVWFDSGGHHINISINGRDAIGAHVDMPKDVWKHICLSYQSDFGAWALYVDARLVACETAQSLYGYVLQGGSSLIIGYGTDKNGVSTGLEGEIFGANMILTSTIERNVTMKNDPLKRQKNFVKNKLRHNKKNGDYIVLSDLQTQEVQNNYEMYPLTRFHNSSQNYIKFSTPDSFIMHSIGSKLAETTQKNLKLHVSTVSRNVLDANDNDFNTFWNVLHNNNIPKKLSKFAEDNIPKISEFETPPPLVRLNQNIFGKTFGVNKSPVFRPVYTINEDFSGKKTIARQTAGELSEVETPPLPDKNNKAYNQWVSSKFAGSVLNYLKSINFHKKEPKKVPATIPLNKVFDNFPYASEFKKTRVRPPPQFRGKNLIDRRIDSFTKDPQINVQILEDDLRSSIIKSHAQTHVKNVDIINRGNSKKNDHRTYRNVENQDRYKNSAEKIYEPKPFSLPKKNYKYSSQNSLDNSNLLSILPFLKTLEYFVEDSHNTESKKVIKTDDMYIKNLSSGNKWHNVKSYSNDYTPRQINTHSENDFNELQSHLIPKNHVKHPTIRLKYKPENRKIVKSDDLTILKGRELAQQVSNVSNNDLGSISITKYNHGYLPGHDKKIKIDGKLQSVLSGHIRTQSEIVNNFNKHVKIGNALNERHVIGDNDAQRKQSFIGGDESIPDINKYRSDIDNESSKVPPSLGPRICKDTELYEPVLYVRPDDSIDMTNILSPVKMKNIGIEFVTQNYKKCSLTDSSLEKNQMLFIDWSKTPVRLFGGAYAKTTTDLCGFF